MKYAMKLLRTTFLAPLLMLSDPAPALAAQECPEVEAVERTLQARMKGDTLQASPGERVQAGRRQQDVQAGRGQQDVQAPRDQQDVQAPRDQQDVQAPRGRQDVQAPRDDSKTAARLSSARALIDEARAACERGDRTGAREKAGSAMELVKTL